MVWSLRIMFTIKGRATILSWRLFGVHFRGERYILRPQSTILVHQVRAHILMCADVLIEDGLLAKTLPTLRALERLLTRVDA